MSIIASDLDALNASFEGLQEKVGKWVPCVCSQCTSLASPELFEQRRLVKRRADGRLDVECPSSYEDVSVLELLDGLRLDQVPKWATEIRARAPTADTTVRTGAEQTIRIFLASSKELREDRDQFDLYFRQQNDRLRREGIYLEIVRWEDFLDAMSKTRKQDEYNQAVRESDLFVCLFKTKTGNFTEEEFEEAHRSFQSRGRPLIYTFFRTPEVVASRDVEADLKSLWAFQKRLHELGHFYTEYGDIEHLKRQFRDQLDKLREQDML